MACAASSMTGMPARSAAAMIGSMSAASPKRCTGMMALVRGVIAARVCAGSMLNVAGSMSTSTGVAPTRTIAPAVAKNENVVVTTSSPAPMPSAMSASRSASVPDDTAIACFTPSRAASSDSSASISGPMMKRWLSHTRVTAVSISSRKGRYWASRSRRGTGMGLFYLPRDFTAARVSRSVSRFLIVSRLS